MEELTIIIREKTITLSQMVFSSSKVRLRTTIPKDKILLWLHSPSAYHDTSRVLHEQAVPDNGGKLMLVGTMPEQSLNLTAAELDALDKGF